MIRFFTFFFLVFSGFFGLTWLGIVENCKAHSALLLEQGKGLEGLAVTETWLQYSPSSDLAWYYRGRFEMEIFGSSRDPRHLEEASRSFSRSIGLFPRNPRVWYWWANLFRLLARMRPREGTFTTWMDTMRLCCAADPSNYFYYSVYFENLMAYGSDLAFIKAGVDRKRYLSEVAYAFGNYANLKNWYFEKYRNLVEFHFDGEERRLILDAASKGKE